MNYTMNHPTYICEKKAVNSSQGFTLIELMIVVAIIGILAAIAIPQFSAYRIRAFNSAAESDLYNATLAEEALFAGNQFYGTSTPNTTAAAAVGGAGIGTPIDGSIPLAAGNGHFVAISAANGGPGLNFLLSVSRGVQLRFDTNAGESTYVGVTEHLLGNRAYGSDVNTGVRYWAENPNWIGAVAGINALVPVATPIADDFNGFGGGGIPVVNWSPR